MATPTHTDALQVAGRRVQPDLNRIDFDGRSVTLEPKVLSVLLRLAEDPGRVVSRQELLDSVWNGDHVTDDVLTRAIGELRRYFNDDAKSPQVIETIRQRGYRLIAEVERDDGPPSAPTKSTEPEFEGLDAPTLEPVTPATGETRKIGLAAVAGWIALAAMGVVAAVAMLVAGARDVPSTDVVRAGDARPRPELRIAPLTSRLGQERDPAVSPDGSRVAYVRVEDGGEADLWLTTIRGQDSRKLTSSSGQERYPVWSPEANELAFVRMDVAETRCERALLNIVSGGQRTLAPCDPLAPLRMDWSPDGRFLAIVDRTSSGWGIHRLDLSTLESRVLTDPPAPAIADIDPAFSPDGRTLVFTRLEGSNSGDLFTVDLIDGTERRLTFDRRDIIGQAFEADGAGVVMSSDRAGSYGLWRVSTIGGTPQWLAGSGNKIKHPSHSRNASVVVWEDWRFSITIVAQDISFESLSAAPSTRDRDFGEVPDRGEPREPVVEEIVASTQWDFSPVVSPNGDYLAFVSSRFGPHQLWLRHLGPEGDAGSSQLTDETLQVTSAPSWSPSGEQLVFAALRGDVHDLWVLDVATLAVRPVGSVADYVRSPVWSNSGSAIYYFVQSEDGLPALFRASWREPRLSRSTPIDLEPVLEDVLAVRASRDGALWMARASRDGLFRLDVESSEPEPELILAEFPRRSASNWALLNEADGGTPAAILWVESRLGRNSLVRTEVNGGTRSSIPILDLARPGISLAPDGQRLYYAISRGAEADLMFGIELTTARRLNSETGERSAPQNGP